MTIDYLTDQLPTYYGTPLVNVVQTGHEVEGLLHSSKGVGIIKGSLYKYYNVSDPPASSQNVTPTLHVDWQMEPEISLHDRAYFYYSKRR